MDNKKLKAKSKIKVNILKSFIYPLSVIDNNQHAKDIAVTDYLENLEINSTEESRQKIKDNYEITIVNEKSFKLRKQENQELNDFPLNFKFTLEGLVNYSMEQEYGLLNIEKNPKLFVYESAIKSEDGKEIICEEEWYLHPEIEKVYNKYYSFYSQLLLKINNLQ